MMQEEDRCVGRLVVSVCVGWKLNLFPLGASRPFEKKKKNYKSYRESRDSLKICRQGLNWKNMRGDRLTSDKQTDRQTERVA